MIKPFLLLLLLSPVFSIGQEIIAKEGSFGIDHKKNIIVWHVSNLDSILSVKETPKTIYFSEGFTLKANTAALSYTNPIELLRDKTSYSLYLTRLPIVHISIDTLAINNRKKIPGYFTYFNKGKVTKTLMGIRHRGNLSLSFPKKSYDLEFWTDTITKQTKDVKFKAMRSDDDWILDALYNEPLKLRSTIATKLWNKIHQPYYIVKEPKAKSGFDVTNVEVFKNNSYWGVYALSESIDKKQLKLKSHIGTTISGELIKAESYEGSPSFTKAEKYNNLFPHWGGFEMEYPLIDYRAYWNNLAAFCSITVNGKDDEFKNTIANQIHIKNTIDYYLFVNILRATDNLGKNYYLAKYEANEPYFFVPWDLDGVLGIIQEGKHISTTNDVLGNGLFNRLLEVNPNGYKQKVKSRWKTLRETHFSTSKLFQNINETYTRFDAEKIYDREQMAWPKDSDYTAEYNYLETWLKERLAFLDSHFESL